MRATLTKRGVTIVAVSATVLTLGASLAYAALPDSSGNYTACVLKNVGTVRLVDTAKQGLAGHCSSYETQISWQAVGRTGATGPTGRTGLTGALGPIGPIGPVGPKGAAGVAGPAGPAGPKGASGAAGAAGPAGATGAPGAAGATGATGATGARGPAGASGYEVQSSTTTLAANYAISGSQPCSAGKVAVGGGMRTTPINAAGVTLVTSAPDADGKGWSAGVTNMSASQVSVTLSAICIDAPPAVSAAARANAKAAHPKAVWHRHVLKKIKKK